MSATSEKTEIRKEFLFDVPVAKVHPCPWNPNQQDERTFEATKESLIEFGFIDPMTVWPHPEKKNEWMCLDGEHRWRAVQELHEAGVLQVVDLVVLHGLSEAQARKLTIILNETRGDANVAKLGSLLADIDRLLEGDKDALRIALPYSDAEMKHLLDIGATNWDDFAGGDPPAPASTPPRPDPQPEHSILLGFDQAQRERYDTFQEMLQRELGEAYTPEEAVLSALSGACQAL